MNEKPFVVGDLQGCCDELEQLLVNIKFDQHHRPLWAVGDLVNRGPKSIETLRLLKSLGDRFVGVLGNHDLHLLAMVAGVRSPGTRDTAASILEADDADELIDWLRHCPLAYTDHGYLMVHAGLYPAWTVEQLLMLTEEVQTQLRGPDWQLFLRDLYGNKPRAWSSNLASSERFRFIINACTRMRFVKKSDFALELESKEGTGVAPKGTQAWFEFPSIKSESAKTTIIFGHWSTLGLVQQSGLIGLDTGCVWGGALSAIDLDSMQIHQVKCQQHQAP